MRICVIFNPTARGEKARRFQSRIESIGGECAFKPTTARGAGRILAAEAVDEGFDTIIAAGGDGTLNEVVTGLADRPGDLARARVGVIPLGTVNVFAKELDIPADLAAAWRVIRSGRERTLDLGLAEFTLDGQPARRCFAQLGGAGLDARAVELVDWQTKKKLSQMAYILAGLKAMRERQPMIEAQAGEERVRGELVLVGNGRFYGGRLGLFPSASMVDGRLDVCVFPKVRWTALFRYGLAFVTGRVRHAPDLRYLQTPRLTLRSSAPVAFELDGEFIGHLPVTLSIIPRVLRVLVP